MDKGGTTKYDKGEFGANPSVSDLDKKAMVAYHEAEVLKGRSVAAVLEALGKRYDRSPRQIQRYITAVRSTSSPRLSLGTPQVDLYTGGLAIARYATLEIAAEGAEARDCWARVTLLSSRRTFPLHWAGTPYSSEETTASRIIINPVQPARLDVAIALPPPRTAPTAAQFPQAIVSGQITAYFSGSELPEWTGQGCWLGQPVALYNPDPRLESYLPPGEYRIRVSVGCQDREGDEGEFVLVSPSSWEHLVLERV